MVNEYLLFFGGVWEGVVDLDLDEFNVYVWGIDYDMDFIFLVLVFKLYDCN